VLTTQPLATVIRTLQPKESAKRSEHSQESGFKKSSSLCSPASERQAQRFVATKLNATEITTS